MKTAQAAEMVGGLRSGVQTYPVGLYLVVSHLVSQVRLAATLAATSAPSLLARGAFSCSWRKESKAQDPYP